MFEIKETVFSEIVINKSKFVTFLIPCNDITLVDKHLNEIKQSYRNATHYCYAYSISNFEKAVDDGEPSGTAGLPILNIIKKNCLTNVLCVVVRYFGGVKLGSGGLIRAYGKCANECVKGAVITPFTTKIRVIITFDYDVIDQIDYLLKDIDIIKNFDELITYTFLVNEDFDLSILDKFIILKRAY